MNARPLIESNTRKELEDAALAQLPLMQSMRKDLYSMQLREAQELPVYVCCTGITKHDKHTCVYAFECHVLIKERVMRGSFSTSRCIALCALMYQEKAVPCACRLHGLQLKKSGIVKTFATVIICVFCTVHTCASLPGAAVTPIFTWKHPRIKCESVYRQPGTMVVYV